MAGVKVRVDDPVLEIDDRLNNRETYLQLNDCDKAEGLWTEMYYCFLNQWTIVCIEQGVTKTNVG